MGNIKSDQPEVNRFLSLPAHRKWFW